MSNVNSKIGIVTGKFLTKVKGNLKGHFFQQNSNIFKKYLNNIFENLKTILIPTQKSL